jgi:hypothetical protein
MIKKHLIILLLLAIMIKLASSKTNEKYPEMSDEEFLQYEFKFREEKNEDEKKYLEPVVRSNKFDLNKDGKISRREIREALKYALYPKDPIKRINIHKDFDTHIKNNIDLFIQNLDQDFFTFRQFSNMMKNISPVKFLNSNIVDAINKIHTNHVKEVESDL